MNQPTLFIENISRTDIETGFHMKPGRCVLIQIKDYSADLSFPKPLYEFDNVYQFEFMDAEDRHDDVPEELKITQQQADDLVKILQYAREERMNVIVHCHAGLCRSGAVAEVGTILGFVSTGRRRLPNLRVKGMMMKALGLSYDVEKDREIQKHTFINSW